MYTDQLVVVMLASAVFIAISSSNFFPRLFQSRTTSRSTTTIAFFSFSLFSLSPPDVAGVSLVPDSTVLVEIVLLIRLSLYFLFFCLRLSSPPGKVSKRELLLLLRTSLPGLCFSSFLFFISRHKMRFFS